jgi:tRNA(Ile)-lysidine synthase
MTRPLYLNAAARRLGHLVARACPAAADGPGAAAGRPGVVVALSGGPDSVALLLVARHWARGADAPLVAAHLHHGLRPGAADHDAAFCAALCRDLDVELVLGEADPRPVARERGGGLEEAARHVRRRFLTGVLGSQPGPGCIATGHHRDDQAETVLMRLLRGTGPEGLRGIRPVAGPFVHPLLAWDRAAIVAFLQEQGQPWRVDASNLDGDNLRARLRREVLPLLREVFGEGCLAGPARLARLLETDLALLDELADQALARARDGQALRVAVLLDLPPALATRVVRRWLAAPAELTAAHVDGVLRWLREGVSGGSLDLPGGRRLTREFDRLLPGTVAAADGTGSDRGAGQADLAGPAGNPRPEDGWPEDWRPEVRRLADGEDGGRPGVGDLANPDSWHLVCPAAALRGNLRVRGWRRGDRLRPLGLGGSRRVSDVLREARVPATRRAQVPVVADDDGILWVVGLVRDERTRLLPGTTGMVTISLIRRQDTTTRGTRSP